MEGSACEARMYVARALSRMSSRSRARASARVARRRDGGLGVDAGERVGAGLEGGAREEDATAPELHGVDPGLAGEQIVDLLPARPFRRGGRGEEDDVGSAAPRIAED